MSKWKLDVNSQFGRSRQIDRRSRSRSVTIADRRRSTRLKFGTQTIDRFDRLRSIVCLKYQSCLWHVWWLTRVEIVYSDKVATWAVSFDMLKTEFDVFEIHWKGVLRVYSADQTRISIFSPERISLLSATVSKIASTKWHNPCIPSKWDCIGGSSSGIYTSNLIKTSLANDRSFASEI